MAEPEAVLEGGGYGSLDFSADVRVVQQTQRAQSSQPDSGSAVTPGGRTSLRPLPVRLYRTFVRMAKIQPIPILWREQAAFVLDRAERGRAKTSVAGRSAQFQKRPGDPRRPVGEARQRALIRTRSQPRDSGRHSMRLGQETPAALSSGRQRTFG